MDIGKMIYIRRKELGLTLEEVGNYVGVGKSTVMKWESGYIANIKRDKIAKLAEILQINPVSFITGDYNEQQNKKTTTFPVLGDIAAGFGKPAPPEIKSIFKLSAELQELVTVAADLPPEKIKTLTQVAESMKK